MALTNTRKPARAKPIVFGKAELLTAIAASALIKPQRLEIDELNGVVFVKRLTLGEREAYFEDMKTVTGSGNAEAFIKAIVTENGEHMFDDADVEIIHTLPPVLTEAVLATFNKINRFFIIKAGEKPSDKEDADLKNS